VCQEIVTCLRSGFVLKCHGADSASTLTSVQETWAPFESSQFGVILKSFCSQILNVSFPPQKKM
jgi:hypothetical protein